MGCWLTRRCAPAIETITAERVLRDGAGEVRSRDSRKLLAELCGSGVDLQDRDQALATLIAATDRLTKRMPKWPTRWSRPELISRSA